MVNGLITSEVAENWETRKRKLCAGAVRCGYEQSQPLLVDVIVRHLTRLQAGRWPAFDHPCVAVAGTPRFHEQRDDPPARRHREVGPGEHLSQPPRLVCGICVRGMRQPMFV